MNRRVTLLTWATTLVALYHLVVLSQIPAFLGYFLPDQIHLAISLACALVLIFMLRRARATPESEDQDDSAAGSAHVPWYDIAATD